MLLISYYGGMMQIADKKIQILFLVDYKKPDIFA